MISIEQAREAILNKIKPLPGEKLFLDQSLGRYLAQDVYSERNIPPWDNSAMDGFAVHTEDLATGEGRLGIAYEIPAGALPQGPFEKGTAVKIMTGAPVPPGADAVVKREDTDEREGEVTVLKAPAPGENIRASGEDLRAGELVLRAGIRLASA